MAFDTASTKLDSYLETASGDLSLEKLKLCRRHLQNMVNHTS